MATLAVTGAATQCTFGAAPGTLTASPTSRATAGTQAAVITDIQPFANIGAFGVCSSLANPVVASATAAASGTLTPQPCTPVVPAPWTPGTPRVLIGNVPAVGMDSTCTCAYAGLISITSPGQVRASAG